MEHMSALRVPPGRLWAAAAANAARCPLPAHHREVYAILSRAKSATVSDLPDSERWFLNSVLRLSTLSERQQARLRDIAVKAERGCA